METKEFIELKRKVEELLKESFEDKSEAHIWEIGRLRENFLKLPNANSVTNTLKGIVGFHNYCVDYGYETQFLLNAIHDLSECVTNSTKPWFSPRLSRYVGYETNSNG